MSTTLEFDITADEARQAVRFKQRTLLRRVQRARISRLVAVSWWVALTGMFFMLGRLFLSAPPAQLGIFCGWLAAAIALGMVYRGVLRREAMRIWLGKDSYLVGHHVLSFDVDGVRETSAKTEAWWRWDAVTVVEDAQPGVFITKGSSFFFIPRRSFANPEEAKAFVAELGRLASAVPESNDPSRGAAS